MSSDTATLLALEKQTKAELRYFELVILKFVGESHQCFCAVGKHGIYFLRRNLSGLYPTKEGGEILFAHIERILEDRQGPTDLLVVMSSNRPSDWSSENIFIVSETRSRLVSQIVIAWQTSYTWRFGAVKSLPCMQHDLRKSAQPGLLQVQPWRGWQRLEVNGYYLFIPNTFKLDKVNAVQAGTGTVCKDEEKGAELHIHVQPPVSLIDLENLGHDHIRWIAMDYKQHVAEQNKPNIVVIQNAFYLKKMNLANDLASWSCWELYLKSEYHAIVTILLRRQHAPPLLDTAQDISVMLKCPLSALNEGKVKDEDLLREARLAADSMHPIVKNCAAYPSVYRDMIQAKLDALLFNEDSIKWIERMIGLKPACEPHARRFIKSILKMLQDENALNMPDLLGKVDLPNQVIQAAHDPMQIPIGLTEAERRKFDNESLSIANAWDARVARYFASMLDGGLLGADFMFADVTNAFLITPVSRKAKEDIINYLLHIRPKNMEEPYECMTISKLLNSEHFNEFTFNDRAMQTLIELKWVEKCLSDDKEEKKMSKEYAKFLHLLLISKTVSTSLKVVICRQIMKGTQNEGKGTQKEPMVDILIPALMDTMVQGNLYLTTYCTATLVNLSRGQDLVKNMLVDHGIAPICKDQLQSTDDDLTQYTLVLLTNITKSMNHREKINRCGIVKVLDDILVTCYAKPDKKKVLTELASVIGQLCNDEDTRKELAGPDAAPISCFLETFKRAENNIKLKAKVMFALRQLIANSTEEVRKRVGGKVIAALMGDLSKMSNPGEAMDSDFATHGLLLLEKLSLSQENCNTMTKDNAFTRLLNKLKLTKIWTVEATREKLIQLEMRLAGSAKYKGD